MDGIILIMFEPVFEVAFLIRLNELMSVDVVCRKSMPYGLQAEGKARWVFPTQVGREGPPSPHYPKKRMAGSSLICRSSMESWKVKSMALSCSMKTLSIPEDLFDCELVVALGIDYRVLFLIRYAAQSNLLSIMVGSQHTVEGHILADITPAGTEY